VIEKSLERQELFLIEGTLGRQEYTMMSSTQ
jgi:hypothetical protein